MKRLLMIHTGGTLMMKATDPSGPLSPDRMTEDLMKELPVLKQIAEIESLVLYRYDSADLQPENWVEMARVVSDRLAQYDGFVIVHGTDTMAYSASALAFLLPGLDRPVVLTGAQKPLTLVRTDARANLVDACHVATLDVPEVSVAFSSRIFRGCRVVKMDAWAMNAFGSPTCAPLVELGLGVNLGAHVLPPRPRKPFDPRIEPKVLAVRTFPGLDPSLISGALSAGVAGLVFEAYGAGNVPKLARSLIRVIEEARDRDVPVVIVSQCPRGSVDLGAYEGGVLASRAGAISARDMTAEAALAKLMIALGRVTTGSGRIASAAAAFEESWAGEVSITGHTPHTRSEPPP